MDRSGQNWLGWPKAGQNLERDLALLVVKRRCRARSRSRNPGRLGRWCRLALWGSQVWRRVLPDRHRITASARPREPSRGSRDSPRRLHGPTRGANAAVRSPLPAGSPWQPSPTRPSAWGSLRSSSARFGCSPTLTPECPASRTGASSEEDLLPGRAPSSRGIWRGAPSTHVLTDSRPSARS